MSSIVNTGKEEGFIIEHRIGTRKLTYNERQFFMMEIVIKGGKIDSFCQGKSLCWDKSSIYEMKEEFNSMREAFFKPVIDINNFPNEYKPKKKELERIG